MTDVSNELVHFDLTNDAFFKSEFRSIEARAVVSRFLSEVTGIDYETLFNADFQGGELVKRNKNEKGKISDCIVRISNTEKIICEMNRDIFKNICSINIFK